MDVTQIPKIELHLHLDGAVPADHAAADAKFSLIRGGNGGNVDALQSVRGRKICSGKLVFRRIIDGDLCCQSRDEENDQNQRCGKRSAK